MSEKNLVIPEVIIGLGNPEKKYDRTRHNIGFEIVDADCMDLLNAMQAARAAWSRLLSQNEWVRSNAFDLTRMGYKAISCEKHTQPVGHFVHLPQFTSTVRKKKGT